MRPLEEKTAGQLCQDAAGDRTIYDPLEVAYGMTDDVVDNLMECAHSHERLFGEDEYFVILQKAKDPLLENVVRHKYYADLFMPEPRPEQMVCLYNRTTNSLRRLWSLPNAKVMSVISEMPWVDARWEETKFWCDAFFNGDFFERIRRQYGINHYSKIESLKIYEDKLRKSCSHDLDPSLTKPRDGIKGALDEIINPLNAGSF